MTALLPGTQVQARGLRWEVVFTQPAGDQTLYRLRCQDGWMRGEEFDLLSPFEEIRPLTTEMDPTKADLLHKWRVYHQAFLLEQALGPQALLTVQPGRLQLAPYQLVPVMRALSMSRPRLMLADGVGLGKTVEAGLVLSELIARRRAHRILIVSPAGPLLHQWRGVSGWFKRECRKMSARLPSSPRSRKARVRSKANQQRTSAPRSWK